MTFAKSVRLRTRGEFLRVAKAGRRQVGRFLCIDHRPAAHSKLGITASNRYGSAPERNRFKRLVREAYRHHRALLPPHELNIVPRQCAKKAKLFEIEEELRRLLGGK